MGSTLLPVPVDLHEQQAARLQALFDSLAAAGKVRQMVVPWAAVGAVWLPLAYREPSPWIFHLSPKPLGVWTADHAWTLFCVPHVRRPWLYRLRFVVAALSVYLNMRGMASTSSGNAVGGYCVGVLAVWGFMVTMQLLIWTRPQFDMARVNRRRKTKAPSTAGDETTGHQANGHSTEKNESVNLSLAVDESMAPALKEWEYYWEPYPADGTLIDRVPWVLDLVLSNRGLGWNWCPSCFPRFRPPSNPQSGELVDLGSIPVTTRAGYSRSTTYRSFWTSRISAVALIYLVVEAWGILRSRDAYWALGPELATAYQLPPYLASLPPALLAVERQVVALVYVFSTTCLQTTLQQMAAVAVGPSLLGIKGHLWQHPPIWGPFSAVLDRGMAGFWGTFWHQTFRPSFTAMGEWLLNRGYLRRRGFVSVAVCTFTPFALSALLHGVGSFTTTATDKRPWDAAAFFILCWVGIVVQWMASAIARQVLLVLGIEKVPRTWKRAANLLFVAAWLQSISWLLVDDFCRTGLTLPEMLPFSVLRALGWRREGESIIRWKTALGPFWHTGHHWWETGVTI